MIKIAIIEDNMEMLRIIEKHIMDIAKDNKNVELVSYQNAENFLDMHEKGEKFDILLCDIMLPVMNGIELGKRIKEEFKDTYLIYLTSHAQFAVESYQLEAYQYIMKEHMHHRLPQVLRKLLEKIQIEQKKYRVIVNNNEKCVIYYKNIICIIKEKGSKYVIYMTNDGEFRERISLDELMKSFNSNEFIMIERGRVINMRHILKLSGNTIYLDNGVQMMISRARMCQVKSIINTYWGMN